MKPSNQNNQPFKPIWSIWTPLIVAILTILALGSLVLFGADRSTTTINQWGSIALVIIILPVLVIGFLMLCVVILLGIGTRMLTKSLYKWLNSTKSYVFIVGTRLETFSDSLTKPVISQISKASGLRTLLNSFTNKNS